MQVCSGASASGLQRLLDRGGPRRLLLIGRTRQAVGAHQRVEGDDILIDAPGQLGAQFLSPGEGLFQILGDRLIVLLADGEIADHRHECRAHGAGERGRAAATAGGRCLAHQFVEEFADRFRLRAHIRPAPSPA